MLNPFRIASRAAGACALALALQFPAQAAPVVELSGATTQSGFDVTVSARDVADLYAYQFTLNFDPALLTALGGTEGAFLPSAGATFFSAGDIDNIAGSISFVLATLLGPLDGVDGSGELATFSFDVEQAGLASFSLSDLVLLDSIGSDIAVEVGGLVAAVPEPTSLWLAAVALFAAIGARTQRPKAA